MLHKITDSLHSIHNTIFTGKVLFHYDRLPSTNACLRDMLQEGDVAEGCVIWTEYQTAGKGQGTHHWVVEKGRNLTFSVLYKPVFLAPNAIFILNKLVTLSILDMLIERYPRQTWHIKWPNDILLNGKKVAGILIETSMRQQVETAIIGIGLNVNQMVFPDLPHATSIRQVSQQVEDIGELLQALLEKLEAAYLVLRREKSWAGINRRYLEHLWGYGQKKNFVQNEEVFAAMVSGVDAAGLLILERNGQTTAYQAGSLKWDM